MELECLPEERTLRLGRDCALTISLPQFAWGVNTEDGGGYNSKLWVTLPQGALDRPNCRLLALFAALYV